MDLEHGIQGIGDHLLYGRQRSHLAGSGAFGDALYELKEKKRRCCWFYSHSTKFYREIVLVSDVTQFLCFPPRKREYVVPKYKLCGATIRRGRSFGL